MLLPEMWCNVVIVFKLPIIVKRFGRCGIINITVEPPARYTELIGISASRSII